jgi:hypothetical protein
VHDRQQDVDERRPGEGRVDEAEEGAEPPARLADRRENGEVGEREEHPGEEVEQVAGRPGARAVGEDRRAEQERYVHPRELELACRG